MCHYEQNTVKSAQGLVLYLSALEAAAELPLLKCCRIDKLISYNGPNCIHHAC